MKINENIILSMVAPHVVDNALTYDKFDELFAMLSRSEQYSVTDLLAAHHIELRDADDDLAQAYATEFTADDDQPVIAYFVPQFLREKQPGHGGVFLEPGLQQA